MHQVLVPPALGPELISRVRQDDLADISWVLRIGARGCQGDEGFGVASDIFEQTDVSDSRPLDEKEGTMRTELRGGRRATDKAVGRHSGGGRERRVG